MMRLLFILALLLPQAPPARGLVVVFVEPKGETFTADEQAAAMAGIDGALAFWRDHLADPIAVNVITTEFITATDRMTDSLDWSQPYWASPNDVTLFVIDSPYPLVGDAVGQAQTPLGLIWVLRTDGDAFAATVAHELGHVVYNLPHAYDDPDDIMGIVPLIAYQRGTIGCTSLARLEQPCARLYVPMVGTP